MVVPTRGKLLNASLSVQAYSTPSRKVGRARPGDIYSSRLLLRRFSPKCRQGAFLGCVAPPLAGAARLDRWEQPGYGAHVLIVGQFMHQTSPLKEAFMLIGRVHSVSRVTNMLRIYIVYNSVRCLSITCVGDVYGSRERWVRKYGQL